MGLLDSIISAESGGNATATNPNSSAVGPGQFISSTWLDMMRKYHPEIQGSDADILAMRTDPALSREMTQNYATQNQKVLTDAGLPVTDGNTYLAHFAGPQGAVKVLQADPNAPVASILGDAAVKANPFLRGMTASDLQGWAARKMGGNQPAQVASASPAMAPSQASSAPLQIAPSAPPIFAQARAQAQDQSQQLPQQPQAPPSYWQQFPAAQMGQAPPIFYAPRKTNVAMARSAPGFFFSGKA